MTRFIQLIFSRRFMTNPCNRRVGRPPTSPSTLTAHIFTEALRRRGVECCWVEGEGALSHGASFHTWCEKTKQAWLVAKLDPNTQKIVNWQLRRRSRKKGIPSCLVGGARCHRWWIHRERREYVCELLGPGRATWLLPHSHHTFMNRFEPGKRRNPPLRRTGEDDHESVRVRKLSWRILSHVMW